MKQELFRNREGRFLSLDEQRFQAKHVQLLKNETEKQFDLFLKTFSQFEKHMAVYEPKPDQRRLFGRPFQASK
jgi:hypothetical protein